MVLGMCLDKKALSLLVMMPINGFQSCVEINLQIKEVKSLSKFLYSVSFPFFLLLPGWGFNYVRLVVSWQQNLFEFGSGIGWG
jgi:hypothetical protein